MAAPRNDNVREKILDTAERLGEERLLTDISLAEIARESGVSKGTLYYHFKTKDSLLLGLTEKYLDNQWQELIDWTANKEKDTSLHRLVKYIIERNTAKPAMRLHLVCSAMLGNEEIRAKFIERYSEFAKVIAEKIAERTEIFPADFLSWLILLSSDGLMIQSILGNNSFDYDSFISTAGRFLKELK